jgi:hypothetical protein
MTIWIGGSSSITRITGSSNYYSNAVIPPINQTSVLKAMYKSELNAFNDWNFLRESEFGGVPSYPNRLGNDPYFKELSGRKSNH